MVAVEVGEPEHGVRPEVTAKTVAEVKGQF